MAQPYVPDAGDIVWISFDPQTGHEQAGHRPAVVLSPAAYNAKTSLMVCCPMTTQIKNYPFEVVIAGPSPSAVLADQVKSLDWRKRRTKRKGILSVTELGEVRAKNIAPCRWRNCRWPRARGSVDAGSRRRSGRHALLGFGGGAHAKRNDRPRRSRQRRRHSALESD